MSKINNIYDILLEGDWGYKASMDALIYGSGFVKVTCDEKGNCSIEHVPYTVLYEQKTQSRRKNPRKTTKRKSNVKTRKQKVKKTVKKLK